VDFDYRLSPMGTHYIAPLTLNASSSSNVVIALDGTIVRPGGTNMREGLGVPAGIGGLAGENWASFDYVGVTESGDYFVTGDTNAATDRDEFILIDEQIAYREGDAVADGYYDGAIEGAYMNAEGDVGYIWDITIPGGANLEALFLDGELLIREGDLVDWNNDGRLDHADEGAYIENFTGTSSLTISDRMPGDVIDLYFTADCMVNGSLVEGAFRYTVPEPGTLTLLALVGLAALRRR
jgi:hypothetical protein